MKLAKSKKILAVIAGTFIWAGSANAQVASEKPMSAFFSEAVQQKLAAKNSNRPSSVPVANQKALPSAQPMPAMIAESRVKAQHPDLLSRPKVSSEQSANKLPSESVSPIQKYNKRPKRPQVPE
jgi:hypothetical protein